MAGALHGSRTRSAWSCYTARERTRLPTAFTLTRVTRSNRPV